MLISRLVQAVLVFGLIRKNYIADHTPRPSSLYSSVCIYTNECEEVWRRDHLLQLKVLWRLDMNFFLRAKCLVLADDTDSQDHQKDDKYYVPLTALWVQDHGECCMKIRACASIYDDMLLDDAK